MLATLLLACLCAQGALPEAPAAEAYPPVRPTTHVLFFMLNGELRAEPLRKALSELSTKEAACRIVHGPCKASARPGAQFVAVEAPCTLGPKELVPALRKGCATADALAFTSFEGADPGLAGKPEGKGFLGMDVRDFVLGMSGDLRWYDAQLDWRQFYFARGSISAKEIADRYKKLFEPIAGGKPGEVERAALRWMLAEPLDPKAAARAEKEIGKLAGVSRCTLDAARRTLELQLRLENLESSGPLQEFAKADGAEAPIRARFDTAPLFGVLDKEKLGLAAPAAAGGK